MIGIGDLPADFCVYIENKPPLERYQTLTTTLPIKVNEVKNIADETGNHWRKIFNVYAKLYFEYAPQQFQNWQALRDQQLLQQNSNTALFFSPPVVNALSTVQELSPIDPSKKMASKEHSGKKIKIIMGRTYAKNLGLSEHCYWLSEDFAINTQARLLICPYFDYRQLSNVKITQLIGLIKSLDSPNKSLYPT
jgi:hypothetical protein